MNRQIHLVCPACGSINRLPENRLKENPRCGSCKKNLFNLHPVELTDKNFQKHLEKSDIPLIVDFWAAWCGPCKIMGPVFEQAAARLEPYARLAKVNTETEVDLASRFSIRNIPTMIIFKNGREAARNSGAIDLAGLIKWVKSYV